MDNNIKKREVGCEGPVGAKGTRGPRFDVKYGHECIMAILDNYFCLIHEDMEVIQFQEMAQELLKCATKLSQLLLKIRYHKARGEEIE